jgi:hypothetical protein
MIAPNKKLVAIKFSVHNLIILTVHTAKIVTGILRRRRGGKMKAALGEDQFGFIRGK